MNFDPDAYLAGIIDRERAHAENVFMTDQPVGCDLCRRPFRAERFLIDGETKGSPQLGLPNGAGMGQWAHMCNLCFAAKGVGVAWGSGQLYEQTPSGEWLQVAGFPPVQDFE